MKCFKCQHEYRPQAKFCEECGTSLLRSCANCSTELSANSRFCPECGHPVAIRIDSQRPHSSPETYTPKHLAEKILTSKTALEGERKQVTVLFADMKGSMELLADRDPEEARKLLDPVIAQMMEAVHRFEGTVSNLMGDGIMALFGAPLAHEDHAVRACYAALRMQESVKRYAEGVRGAEGVPIQIRVGLNSGEVVVGSIGNDLKMDYTAVGQTTHLAARMEQAAIPGTVLVSGDTLRLAEGYVEAKSLGPLVIKGLSEAMEVYEVTGAASVRSRFRAAAIRGLTRFVGRDAEVEHLHKALEQAKKGQGQVVAMVGEAGVGKSRLYYEFTGSHRTKEWLILESGSSSYGKATPYLPIIELIKTYCQIEAGDDHRKIREKLTGKLLTLDRALEPILPAFLALLEVPVDDPEWNGFDPPQRRRKTLDAIKRLLLREGQVQPLLLVFEDLHWIDSETQAFLDSMVESLPTARILLLVNYRPEYQYSWGNKTYYSQLSIDPLPPVSAEELLNSLLGKAADLLPLKRLLIQRTEGNPFFLEESVRTLVETQALAGERGSYRLTKTVEGIQVPATVQAVLAARIDRLPPEEKQLLQSASVIGETVPFSLLQKIAGLPEPKLQYGLGYLQEADFIYETSVFPELEYTFKHGLTYHVAYNSLLQGRRRVLHAQLVDSIETLYCDRLGEQVERLAHHARRAELWRKAVAYLRQAGQKAASRFANREALGYFNHALEGIAFLPKSRETLELGVDVRLETRPSLLAAGRFDQMGALLNQAESLCEQLGDKGRLGRVVAGWNTYYHAVGMEERALATGERAVAIATDLSDIELQIVAQQGLARTYTWLGYYRRAIELCIQCLSLLEYKPESERFGILIGVAPVVTRHPLVLSFAELGEISKGIAHGEKALRIAESVGQPFSLGIALLVLGYVWLVKGDLDKAIPILERCVYICRNAPVPLFLPTALAELGYAYLHSGREPEALALLEQAVDLPTARLRDLLHRSWLAEAFLLANQKEKAFKVARQTLDLVRDRKERGHEPWALRTLAEIASQSNPPDVANSEIYYDRAIILAEELGMRPALAHCNLGLGKLYRKIGKLKQARERLTTAMELMRDMEIKLWAQNAELELKELSIMLG